MNLGNQNQNLGIDLLQNDGTREGRNFHLHGSFNHHAINESHHSRSNYLEIEDEIVSHSSFLSKASSKYEVDQLDRAKEPRDIKSQFDSSSSDEGSEEEKDAMGKEVKSKLNFLRRNTVQFTKDDFSGKKRGSARNPEESA